MREKTMVSRVWEGTLCKRCRYPVIVECHDTATHDWRPRCVNKVCQHHRRPEAWNKKPDWVAKSG